MRDHLSFVVNGRRHRVGADHALRTLSEFLREELRLTGTKVVCAEGDCGACSVLLGRPTQDGLRYATIDACITFLFQVDACHVVTVEGLGCEDALHPVQQAMVDHFGSQCGFCTPGFVTTLAGIFEGRAAATDSAEEMTESELRRGLTGNLCRCTGYRQILDAALAVDAARVPRLAQLHEEGSLLPELRELAQQPIRIEGAGTSLFVPTDLDGAVHWLGENPEAKIVAGATDVGVLRNKGYLELEHVLALGDRIPGFTEATIEENVLLAGAGASWTRLLEVARGPIPQLAAILERFGAEQIRNFGTLGGNLVNASPIADSLPFFYVTDGALELVGPEGVRRVPVREFYRGYKELDLRPGELLARVEAALPTEDETLRLYKISKRRDLDISSFTAAILLRRDGDEIRRARLAYGGVGPTVLALRETESFLEGRRFDETTVREAGRIAAGEISPIGDVRGSERYRRQLAQNVLLRFFHEETATGSEIAAV